MQRIIITGHSRGLGQALSAYYLQHGKAVLGLARHGLPEQHGLSQYLLDLSDNQALNDAKLHSVLSNFIAPAHEVILINNAATVVPNALAGKATASEIAQAIQVNVTAPLVLSNALIAQLAPQQRLKIVHISSGAGRQAYAGWCVYGASKAALDHHARCVAAENHANVQIISLAPGIIDTDMQAEIRAASCEDFPLQSRFQTLKEQGQLSAPVVTAKMIAQYIETATFGQTTIADIRD